jgi:hypothetical protein
VAFDLVSQIPYSFYDQQLSRHQKLGQTLHQSLGHSVSPHFCGGLRDGVGSDTDYTISNTCMHLHPGMACSVLKVTEAGPFHDVGLALSVVSMAFPKARYDERCR